MKQGDEGMDYEMDQINRVVSDAIRRDGMVRVKFVLKPKGTSRVDPYTLLSHEARELILYPNADEARAAVEHRRACVHRPDVWARLRLHDHSKWLNLTAEQVTAMADVLKPKGTSRVDPYTLLSHEARELILYMEHDATVWNAYVLPAFRTLKRHKDRGTFDRDKGIKGVRYGVDAAAKCYHREHGSMSTKWSAVFGVKDRDSVADLLVSLFLDMYREGCNFKS